MLKETLAKFEGAIEEIQLSWSDSSMRDLTLDEAAAVYGGDGPIPPCTPDPCPTPGGPTGGGGW
jgi:hypothetical protein